MFNSEDLLAKLTARLPMADLVARQTALRRMGQHLRGTCPFCPDSETACSFYVYEHHFHCYSCGAHGNHVTFLMHAKGIEMEAAIQEIASETGVDIPEQAISELSIRLPRWKIRSDRAPDDLGPS